MKNVIETIQPAPTPPKPTLGADLTVRALVYRVREFKNLSFLHLRTADDLLQAVWTGPLPDGVRAHAAVEVSGRCVPAQLADRALTQRQLELQLTRLELLSPAPEPAPIDISKPELAISHERLFELRPLTLRHPKIAAVFRVQAALTRAFREHLDARGFTELHTPKLVGVGAEGGANIFELDYFGRPASLAQSPQFYKEFGTGVFLRVYEIGPVFRAEKHATTRHLNEYTSMDLELGPIRGFAEVMAVQTGLLRDMMEAVRTRCAHELELLEASVPAVPAIPAVRFSEVKALVGQDDSPDLSPAEELALGRHIAEQTGSDWVFVTHYPSSKRPFYVLDDPEQPECTLSFDLLFRGVEITTGGQRIHDPEQLEAKLRARGLDPEHFRFFTQAHRFGLPPHGGLGMGLERLTQCLLGLDNIKQASLFPRDRNRLTP